MKNPKQEYPGFEEYFLADDGEDWCLVGRGEYPDHSVLAGQHREQRLEWFDTRKEAQEAYPDVQIGGFSGYRAEVPMLVPSWFDPADAGEVWGEDEY